MSKWLFDFVKFLLWMVFILTVASTLQGCVTRGEVEASIWLHNGMPKKLCDEYKELWDYGIYRRLDNGKFEFIPYCKLDENGKPYIKQYLSINSAEFNKILDELLPKQED